MTRFMVQWADHPSHLATRLGQLLEHQTLVDVTLMCNTHTLRVHRAVLAAGSPYFETILQRQLGQHPLIVLKDMQFTVLKCLIEFMYCGETSVTEDNLPALLQAAKFFQVRGLSAMTKEALGLKSGPSDLAINGAGDAGAAPSVHTPQAITAPRPGTKRVNVEGKPTPPSKQRAVLKPRAIAGAEAQGSPKQRGQTGDVPRMTFHTIPKTVPTRPLSSRSNETQADNARLLLSLSGSESFQTKTATSAPPATVLGRPRQPQTLLTPGAKNASKPSSGGNKNIRFHHNVSGIIPPIGTKLTLHEGVNRVVTTPKRRGRPPARTSVPKTLTPALKLALENQAKNKTIAPKPPPVVEPTLPMEFVAVEKEDGAGDEKTPTLYRDPNTNILYQVEDAPATETETIIYQLPDGTITDKDGNAIVDEDGNTQNINNYQMERGGGDVVYQMEGTSGGEEEGNVIYQMEGTEEEGVATTEEGGTESLTHSEYMDVLKRAGLPTDMPILLDSGDGNYVAVNEEVLRNIVDGGVLQCQVTEGNLVREDGEEFLVQPEEPVAEPQEQVEEPMQHEEEAVEHLEPAEDVDSGSLPHEEEVKCEQQEEQEEEQEEEEEMTIVGKSLPSLDDEGEEEVITGDPYGELSFQGDTSDHNFSSQEESSTIVEEEASASVDPSEFLYEEHKESSEDDDSTKPPISVEQALEEMMGEEEEGGETEEGGDVAEKGGEVDDELDNLQNVLNSSVESDPTAGAANGNEAKTSSSLLKNALRESGIVEPEDGLDREADSLKEVVYEITNEDGERRRITVSGEAILLPPGDGAGTSPSKDIPYAVGLLPLQTALEKIQSMPDHQPRKTRSSDDQQPNNNNKRRRAESTDGPDKRPKLAAAEESETEDADGSNDMESLIPELVEANDN